MSRSRGFHFSEELTEIMRAPGMRAAYDALKEADWLSPFFDVLDRNMNRLGAKLVIEELLDLHDASQRAARAVERARARAVLEADIERTTNVRKRGRPAGSTVAGAGRRGECSACGDSIALTIAGRVRKHWDAATNGTCFGSNALPFGGREPDPSPKVARGTYGQCDACGGFVSVKQDGTSRLHRDDRLPFGETCRGSGHPIRKG